MNETVNRISDEEMRVLMDEIYQALCEKGYNPTRQIAGYILSEDPVHINDWKNARGKIARINRDDLLRVLINSYFGIESSANNDK